MYITISCMRLQEKPGIKAREKQSSVRSFKISKSSLGIKARGVVKAGDVLDELQQSFSKASAKLSVDKAKAHSAEASCSLVW